MATTQRRKEGERNAGRGPAAVLALLLATVPAAPAAWAAEMEGGSGMDAMRMHSGGDEEQPLPWLTGNKAHKYLGIGSLVAAGLAAVSAPGTEDPSKSNNKGFHHWAGWTATALGGAAVGTGLVFHWEDFRLKDGFTDPDNLHALLGILGTTGFAIAVGSAPDSDHSDVGMVGAAAMLIGIEMTW